MLHTPARVASRRLLLSARSSTSRRFLATGPAARPRSWKSSAVRWGLAAGVVWVYGSSKVFAEEEEAAIQKLERTVHSELSHFQTNLDASEGAHAHTVEAVVESRRKAREAAEAEEIKKRSQAEQSKAAPTSESSGIAHSEGANDGEAPTGDVQGLEEEADQQGAFNPETGEINWDCPCLGGMAHGPCGPEFKEAFSCFVHSTEDPKGMECIDKFKHMQDCFRAHPEVYPSEFEDEDEEGEEATAAELESDGHHVAKDAPIAPRKTTVEQTPKAEHDGQDKASEDSGKVVQQLDTSIDNPLPPQSHDATSK